MDIDRCHHEVRHGSGGKRGPTAPLSISSDEGEGSDHDVKAPLSPSSSTSSGPIYVRPPGFTYHGHDIKSKKQDVLKTKKKLKLQSLSTGNIAAASTRTVLKEEEPNQHANKHLKPKREPMPMRRRALPQSFWQQPNNPTMVPPGSNYTVLPPLWKLEKTNEDLSEVRPITPPEERQDEKKESKQSRCPIRTIRTTPPNTDLLFSLFDVIDAEKKKPVVKRGRPKRVNRVDRNKNLIGEDPFMVQTVESLLPSLSLETRGKHQASFAQLSVVSVKDGDNVLSLPSVTVDQNYPALLSEVVKAL